MATTTRDNPVRDLPVRDLIFAEIALRDGKTTPQAIEKGKKVVEEMGGFGILRSLPSILVERNLLDHERERDIARKIAQIEVPCAHCRRPTSLESLGQEGHFRCGHCQSLLAIQLEGKGTGPVPPAIEDRVKSVLLEGEKPGHRPDAREKGPQRSPGAALRPGPRPEPGGRADRGEERPSETEARPGRTGPVARLAAARPQAASGQPRPAPEPVRPEEPPEARRKIQARDSIRGYRIEGVIGSGPSGRLYRAVGSGGKGSPVALKVLSGGRPPERHALKAFDKALADWSRLGEDITGPHEFHEEGSASYVVRPFLQEPWVSLADHDLESLEDPAGVFLAVATRLGAVHAAGAIHGNLKLSNIFLHREDPDRVLLLDPALRLLLPREEVHRWKVLAGDPGSVAPEEIEGGEPTAAADVYALGWVLYALLSGAPAFAGLPPPEVLRRHRDGPCPELPHDAGELRRLHLALTAAAVSERPPHGGAVASLAAEAIAGKKLALGSVTPRPRTAGAEPRRARGRGGRWPLGYVLGPAALLVVLVLSIYSFIGWQKVRTEFSDRKRPSALYWKLAEENFQETKARAEKDPRSGEELWEKFLRTFGETPLRGAAEAEKRNCSTGASSGSK